MESGEFIDRVRKATAYYDELDRPVQIVTEDGRHEVREVGICEAGCHLLVVAEPPDHSVFSLSGKGVYGFLIGFILGGALIALFW